METARILGSLIGISKLNNFEKINKELIPIIEKDICPPEYRNKYYKSHQTGFSFTSDKAGQLDSFESLYGDQLQLNKKFKNFFDELKINLNTFLNKLKYKNVDYFITKSPSIHWPSAPDGVSALLNPGTICTFLKGISHFTTF